MSAGVFATLMMPGMLWRGTKTLLNQFCTLAGMSWGRKVAKTRRDPLKPVFRTRQAQPAKSFKLCDKFGGAPPARISSAKVAKTFLHQFFAP